MTTQTHTADVLISGGGPAGIRQITPWLPSRSFTRCAASTDTGKLARPCTPLSSHPPSVRVTTAITLRSAIAK